MTEKLTPQNLTAQLHYRGAGNPVSVLPRTAISNCFPGLEFDFRNLWRRTFIGLVLLENNNYVVQAEDPALEHLVGHRLLKVDGHDTMVLTQGPVFPGDSSTGSTLATAVNPNAISFMEWSNSLARIMAKQGQRVVCTFTAESSSVEVPAPDLTPDTPTATIEVELEIRHFFREGSAELARELLQPGELTQGLCAPWQNDYRECACYYWAASRPDYVNVEPAEDGLSHGDMWFAKKRTGSYVPDNRTDSRLYSYDDLFKDWQSALSFIIRGKDAETS